MVVSIAHVRIRDEEPAREARDRSWEAELQSLPACYRVYAQPAQLAARLRTRAIVGGTLLQSWSRRPFSSTDVAA